MIRTASCPYCFCARASMILLCLLLLGSCSFKQVYNNMDTLMLEYVEGIVTLDEQLEGDVENRAAALMLWHRESQLNQYADLLRTAQRDYSPKVSEDELEALVADMEGLWRQLMRRLDRDMAELLPKLNARQRNELFSSISAKNARFSREHVNIDDDEREERYRERLEDNFEDWLGDLNDAQEQLIENAAADIKTTSHGRLKARVHWQNSIRAILESNAPRLKKQQRLETFFASFDSNKAVGVKKPYQENRAVVIQLVRDLLRHTDAEQKQHFMEQSNDYIRIFDELRANS